MRPTVEEQLLGTCRVLESVVSPRVTDPFATNILNGVVSNLRMLLEALPAIPDFLRWDNEATAQLLVLVQAEVGPELAEQIVHVLDEPAPDVANWALLEARNSQLRELLSELLRGASLSSNQDALVKRHLARRASRFPMRFVLPTPSTPKE